MDFWFIYAVLSAVLIWLDKFLNKVIAKKWINKNNFLLYSSFTYLIINFIYFLYIESYFYMSILFSILIILRTIFSIEKSLTMIESLKYIDSSLFFPSQHLMKISWWFIIGMFLFWEYLNMNEIIFLVFWVISVLFLWYKKWEFKNKDFKKWIYFMILSSLFIIWTSTINKYVAVNESIPLYMFLSSAVSIFYILFKIKIEEWKYVFNKTEFKYWILIWTIWFFGFIFYLNAMIEWKLVVVQLISTITTLIPIILSYIFLKEEINRYRIIWLLLFIINLWIFYLNK